MAKNRHLETSWNGGMRLCGGDGGDCFDEPEDRGSSPFIQRKSHAISGSWAQGERPSDWHRVEIVGVDPGSRLEGESLRSFHHAPEG
jgi:hypothetical protein